MHAKADASLVGKFDGVTDEVDEDLSYARWIASNRFWDRHFTLDDKVDSFGLRANLHQRGDVGNKLHGGTWDVFDFQFPGFDLGKIKDTIDQLQ